MLLRDLITACGLPVVEIPPVPEGYRFIACLTHDVDHPSIRRHKWDHTTLGFLYRAIVSSFTKFLRGRIPVRALFANWWAAFKLPFVQLGLAEDFWEEFDNRYSAIEEGRRSTYFVIPFEDRPGKKLDGLAPAFRAARYGAKDIAGKIKKLTGEGCEIGLHGIDAWLDSSSAKEELDEIRCLTGLTVPGVRMHWLYYSQQSPLMIEEGGAAYDSTVGYNEAVGYRAGTTQVYRPLNAARLLELPLHVMDTALFYPAHLNLSSREAETVLRQMTGNAVQFGGCLTINWHDRSIAPERLWDTCYRDLLENLTAEGAWFATGVQATSWFRKRRSVVFETDDNGSGDVRASVQGDHNDDLPGLRLRVHRACPPSQGSAWSTDYADVTFQNSAATGMFVGCDIPSYRL